MHYYKRHGKQQNNVRKYVESGILIALKDYKCEDIKHKSNLKVIIPF